VGGFGERLHDAMLAAGIESGAELARRCGVTLAVVTGWLASDGESVSGRQLMVLRRVLRVRSSWLMDGEQPLSRRSSDSQEEAEALALLQSLDARKRRLWLGIGRDMTDG